MANLSIGFGGLGGGLQYPLINGVRHSWSSAEVKVAGQIYYATSVNHGRKRNRTMVRVNHPDPIAKTLGENDYTGDLEMLLAEYNALQAALIQIASNSGLPIGYGDVPFEVQVQYSATGLDTVTIQLLGCTLDSDESGGKQGPDPTIVKSDLSPLKILRNGVDDLGVPLQAPIGT